MSSGGSIALYLTAFTALAAPAGWIASNQLEADSEFCVACHLSEAVPLHETKFERFTAPSASAPAADLTAAHRAAEADFACIDCHGGASFPNQVRVKLVAARDAALYVVGRFEEPTEMQHPLWDEDCAQCHASYTPERDDAFHAIAVHNGDAEFPFEYPCVSCHQAHRTTGDAELNFLDSAVVGPICRNCHEEF